MPIDHCDLLTLWKKHGGSQHGPNVEHVTMPLKNFRGFTDELVAREREECAKIADLYAEENITMAGDTVRADPILSGKDFSDEAMKRSEELMLDGHQHASAYHAATYIADLIRARATGKKELQK